MGTPLTVNITLAVGSATEVVKVEASADQVNTSSATLGNVVERQTVTTLPLNGRNPLNLIVLEPGVTQRSGTTINVNGMRSQAGNVTVDGIEANEASNPDTNQQRVPDQSGQCGRIQGDHQQSHSGRGKEFRPQRLHRDSFGHQPIPRFAGGVLPQQRSEQQ